MSGLLEKIPEPPSGKRGWPWSKETPAAIYEESKNWPRISIVTPSFNQASFLEETIRSILLQNYPNLQYIVVDGGSTDGSVDILKKYAPWIDYWVSEPDKGQSDAINKGLEQCDGEWFNWINSDDFLAPGAFHALMGKRGEHEIVSVSGTTVNIRNGERFSSYEARLSTDWPGLLFSMGVNQPGSLLHLPSVRSVGHIRQELRLVMDLDLWLRLALKYGPKAFEKTGEEVACYRYHDASKTCSGEDVFALEEFALLTDLALHAGVQFPGGILNLRSCCKAPAALFPTACHPIDIRKAREAWMERMVISDSLLFRALNQVTPQNQNPLLVFRNLLRECAELCGLHGVPWSRSHSGTAIIHAMQALNRFEWAPAFHAILLNPRVATLRALAVLALRSRS